MPSLDEMKAKRLVYE